MSRYYQNSLTAPDHFRLVKFVGGVLLAMSFLITLLVVKNQCRTLGAEIDLKRSELSLLQEEVYLLQSDINYLTRPDRIRKIVSDEFGMYSPAPESLIVVLEDYR